MTIIFARRHVVIASLVLADFAAGLEGMIVSTAIPTIICQLGGFAHYTWIFSGYLLTQAISTVIYGRLADIYGCKPVLILGAALELLGSILCGLAWSMTSMIVFRFLQGVGAGATSPISIIIVGEIFEPEQRSHVLGIMGGSFVIGSLIAPIAGSLVISYLSWHWLFWIAVPLGAAAIVGLALSLQEEPCDVSHRKFDFLGASLFLVSSGSLLFVLAQTQADTTALLTLTTLLVGSTVTFTYHQRHTPDPLIPVELWISRSMAMTNVAALVGCATLTAFTTVVPLYIQGVLLRGPLTTGVALTALSLGSVFAFALSGRAHYLLGLRRTLRVGSTLLCSGALLLLTAGPLSTPVLAVGIAFLIGLGHGPLFVLGLAIVQDSVSGSKRGSATASFSFATSLGYTLGPAVGGAVINLGIVHYGRGVLADTMHSVRDQPEALLSISANVGARSIFEHAVYWSFIGIVFFAILTMILVWLIPYQTKGVQELSIPLKTR